MYTSTMTRPASQQSPGLTRNSSPSMDSRQSPAPASTAEMWDRYERQAVETATMRERTTQPSQPPRLVIPNKDKCHRLDDVAPTKPSFDFGFRRGHTATASSTVAVCKTCTFPVSYASGVCESCTKTIVLPSASGETTPPLSPAARNFASTDLQKLRKNSSGEDVVIRSSTSSRRTSYCPLPAHVADPSFRLSALQPPPELDAFTNPIRSRRKTSLTDPNEPFLRLQTPQQAHVPRSQMNSPPITPTSPSPWTTQSRCSTRPSSLANAASLPKPTYPHGRTDSVALSEYSTLCPFQSTATTKLENTMSAWDDWDSDNDDADRAGLASWMGRRKTKGRGSGPREGKSSMDSTESDHEATRHSLGLRQTTTKGRRSISKEEQGLERARIEAAENARTKKRETERQLAKKKPSGFISLFSCARGQDDDA